MVLVLKHVEEKRMHTEGAMASGIAATNCSARCSSIATSSATRLLTTAKLLVASRRGNTSARCNLRRMATAMSTWPHRALHLASARFKLRYRGEDGEHGGGPTSAFVTASFTADASKNVAAHASSSCTHAATSAATRALRIAV